MKEISKGPNPAGVPGMESPRAVEAMTKKREEGLDEGHWKALRKKKKLVA